jgi:peptidoglycan/xylan/chitin deacetylase (PgdA/CDA1 family)
MLQRISSKINRTFRQFLYLSGSERVCYNSKENANLVLMYHNVDLNGDQRFNARHIARHDFRKQLTYFKKRFNIVSLSEMFENPNEQGNRLSITFDDGLANNFTNALPELETLSIPATFYVTCANLQNNSILWPDAMNILTHFHKGPLNCLGQVFQPHPWNQWHSNEHGELMGFLKSRSHDERMQFIEELESSLGIKPNESAPADYHTLLSGAQIKSMSHNPLFEIGSHAISHSNLANLTTEEQRIELSQSKAYLEEITQKSITSIAYPDGSYSRSTIDIAEECGYNHQLAVNYRHQEDRNDPRILDRFGLYNDRSVIEQLHQVNQRLHEEH